MGINAIILTDPKKGKKYYAVCCKCGHVRPNRYVAITFGIKAFNRKEASRLARGIARVKHNKKSAIISCKEISRDEYVTIIKNNRNDPYLKCKNIQEQRLIDGFESRIVKEQERISYKRSKQERTSFIEYKLKKQKLFLKELNLMMQAAI